MTTGPVFRGGFPVASGTSPDAKQKCKCSCNADVDFHFEYRGQYMCSYRALILPNIRTITDMLISI